MFLARDHSLGGSSPEPLSWWEMGQNTGFLEPGKWLHLGQWTRVSHRGQEPKVEVLMAGLVGVSLALLNR